MKGKSEAYRRLAQILVERAELNDELKENLELIDERYQRSTTFDRRESTAEIEERIRVLEASITTRLQLELDKEKKGLLPSYYSPEKRKAEDEKDREEINELKAVLLYRANLRQAWEEDRLKKKG